jgi:hypothetical protein
VQNANRLAANGQDIDALFLVPNHTKVTLDSDSPDCRQQAKANRRQQNPKPGHRVG